VNAKTPNAPPQGLENFARAIPDGDNRERFVCNDCGYIQYDNPRIVVGAIVTWRDRFLLCRRSINPRKGFWTMPAGYMELHESAHDGALREAWEEACAEIELDGLLAVYNVPKLSQVQLIWRARLARPEFAPGPESEEVRLFAWDDIPWADLAFPSVRWALQHWREVAGQAQFAARGNPPGEPGT
jgi:ADP-ribose pyrophosphatase YjhB (NUDIX family)